ncbi:MAG: sugar transporter [Halieaceae bacterium]|nr:sugar transporter [Halieaceae bacterium]
MSREEPTIKTVLKDHKPLSLHVRIAYGFGAVAYGIKDNGFAYFLLLFYTAVVGLDPALAGLALLIALLLDGLGDPIVGYWSDNLRSRWGRRHPFMYAAAIPVAISYALLWQPPDWEDSLLFLYLVMLTVLVRTLITLYETPSSALMPELTVDYDERTQIQAWRSLFGWVGGAGMAVFMYAFLLVPTERYPVGTLNRDGYETGGLIASGVMLLAILVSALGTHHRIALLAEPSPRATSGLRGVFSEVLETLRDRSFFALFVSSIASSVATGLTAALTFLMLTYFWGFSSTEIFYWVALVVVSALLGFIIAPRASKRWGKKPAAIRLGILAFTVQPLPVLLRLLGWMPENNDPMLFPILAVVNTVDLAFVIAMQAILFSMLADLVEHSEVRTGRRSEGVFYSALTFIRKTNQGIGTFIAGLMLSAVSFPQGGAPAEVSSGAVMQLGGLLVSSQWLLWAIMLVALGFYQLDRKQHQSNLIAISTRASSEQ